jgi:hypothetical protein
MNGMNTMNTHAPQIRIPATYLRGGTSKGVFFACRICLKSRRRPAPRAMRCCYA